MIYIGHSSNIEIDGMTKYQELIKCLGMEQAGEYRNNLFKKMMGKGRKDFQLFSSQHSIMQDRKPY